tara:strand:- start:182 stop:433 length:252 start_codon:yes stop_codon:yes gene_type:complete
MKLTKTQLKQIIQEELKMVLLEGPLVGFIEPLFSRGAPGDDFAEAIASRLWLDEEEDFQSLVQAIKSGVENWYRARKADIKGI